MTVEPTSSSTRMTRWPATPWPHTELLVPISEAWKKYGKQSPKCQNAQSQSKLPREIISPWFRYTIPRPINCKIFTCSTFWYYNANAVKSRECRWPRRPWRERWRKKFNQSRKRHGYGRHGRNGHFPSEFRPDRRPQTTSCRTSKTEVALNGFDSGGN
jgi:hypothetical protein